ncbi:MAG: penicillin-binding transpeptidase domain-containing protein [Gemmatimonadales bacterium]|jgi:cell division protein FtsI (penicillin-binding protein 3)
MRHGLLLASLILAVGAVLGRTFQLQVLNGGHWRARAVAQHEARVPLPAPRGTVYDREGRELAISRTTYRVSVAPFELADRQLAAEVLRSVLGLRRSTAQRVAQGERRWIRFPGTYSAVRRGQLEERLDAGLYFEPVVKRFYPLGQLGTEIVGRVDANGRGQSGLELAFDSLLAGQPGYGIQRRDATGGSTDWLLKPLVEPIPGGDLHLTIDAELQALAESVLEDAVDESGATGGDLLILDPGTGELLAAASHRRGWRGPSEYLTAATEPYEAGSTLKPFTLAALLAEDYAGLSDSVDTGTGVYRTAGRTIHDETAHGWLTLERTLAVSSNVGMAKFAERLPEGVQFRYLRNFGFGTPTGIVYPSESPGLLRRPAQWSAQSRASLAIGYEVAVTPLQLTMAYGALANGGILMRPRLVREARNHRGAVRWSVEPEPIRRVVSEEIAARLRDVLAQAVTQGTGRSAGVRGLSVAGKTGTAWRFDREQGYAGRTYTSSFVGLIPSDDPQLVILVKLDEPSGAYYGGATAAPVMRTAVRAALAGSYWSAPPLMGEPDIPEKQAGVPAGQAPAGGPFVFALDAPLRKTYDQGVIEAASAAVPNVRGISMRSAAGRLHAAGWRVVVQGGGRVVSTQPSAGTLLRRGERVVLVGSNRGPPDARRKGSGAG